MVHEPVHRCNFLGQSSLMLYSCISPLSVGKELGRGFRKSQYCHFVNKPSKGSGIKLTPSDSARNTQVDFVCLMSDYTAITF